jgi:hypothetical protein
MKVGDKIVCIKDANFGINWEGIEHIYKVNNLYEILSFSMISNMENYVNIKCVGNAYLTFSLNDDHKFRFKDYFMNIKESRKQKLEKLQKL